MRKEFYWYIGLGFVILMNVFKPSIIHNNTPEIVLIAYSSILALSYFFTRNHWFANETNRFMIIAGRIIMSMIPVATLFAFMKYEGADILLLIFLVSFIPYWVARMFRGTFVKEKIQDMWLYCIFSLPGWVYLFL